MKRGISIHALREEGDFGGKLAYKMRCDFYPRPPRGGRLIAPHNKVAGADISIHALREEGDPDRAGAALPGHISIHALREEGDPKPARMEHRQRISIHALREEGDVHILIAPTFPGNFYPRPPRGGRPGCLIVGRQILQISIHALREEGDLRWRIAR